MNVVGSNLACCWGIRREEGWMSLDVCSCVPVFNFVCATRCWRWKYG